MSDHYEMTGTLIRQVLDDFKYLNRLNAKEFIDLLFPNEWWDEEVRISPYGQAKWKLFNEDRLAFFSGCDDSKFEIMAEYIEAIKRNLRSTWGDIHG